MDEILDGALCPDDRLATQIPVLPEEIVLEVRAYFRALSAWLTSVLERGARGGALTLTDDAHSEAEALMAAVHGAMLAARAYGDPQAFAAITPAGDRQASIAFFIGGWPYLIDAI
jgi:TetR/AcrR family transcriptional repressor of nem operon